MTLHQALKILIFFTCFLSRSTEYNFSLKKLFYFVALMLYLFHCIPKLGAHHSYQFAFLCYFYYLWKST